mmetsp:Transcript_13826/g.13487  ORF Transcript_13826/g.13487 Transcript_13826/m.13487 type:complete len:123 (+) Transcript_13826:173-541(+)|eukprot:CAMPEP_0170550208 /NCGR_PEP_ID=MMETSP0211-20121228/8283_1 /TAXON_ID=311385 /ORGANISM="Pseudokeronopsis sp., Strain OXSARD2" /LENGTH=122 /DNA_ID=CAMNT_0010856633 /DNA_START=764 /DNA_END=1132 /DNA_ORIENTATION=-
MIGTSGTDGILKLWNLFDLEFQLQFIVPKEECVSIAMHQFKPFMLSSYTDGFIRFFDLQTSKNLGRCKVYSDQEEQVVYYKSLSPEKEKLKRLGDEEGNKDYVIQMKILPSGNHVLCATKNG